MTPAQMTSVSSDFSTVATDHFQGGQLVAEHLIAHGHHKIAFLGEERDWGASQRIEGIRQTLKRHGHDPGSVATGFTEHQPVFSVMRRLLASDVTAIFPPDAAPASHNGPDLTRTDYRRALIHYLNASGAEVNTSDASRPMLGVYHVYEVLSGDLSLPYEVAPR